MENWSNLARVATMRTYSRDNENWNDIVERAIGGNTRKVDVPDWERNALRQLMTDRIAMPAGRGLWFSGTPALDVIGGAALNNCWAVTGDKWEHLVLACDLLMLGGGVGMSVQHKYVSKLPKVRETSISHKNTKDAFYIVPDSREGWCELIRLVLKSYFVTGRKFTYSTCCIRGKGERINGFGGTASGPIPLIECIETISKILDARVGKHVRPIDMADLLTCIGRMVVAGNVRRSAIIIIGDPWDREYLTCKRWDLRPVPVYRQFANFSVAASDIEDLHPSFWRTYEAGEPFGFVNLDNIQKYGRMGEEKYDSAILVNPCAEATLENGEPCNLLELFMSRMHTRDELAFAARLMFRYGKRVCLENYHHDIINEVVHRNNRVGVGITGCLQSSLFNPRDLDFAYEAIQEENRIYSAELGVPESIRTTVVKPSGTLSILGDCTPGIHPAFAEYYIRRVRFADNSPLIPVLRDAGHKVEPQKNIDGSLDYGTLVVDFPVHMPNTPTADQMTTWQQLDIVKMAQRHWADQSVSVTVYYKKPEIEDLKDWVGDNLKYLKTLSFLCYDDHGFEQAPMEKISKEQYERIANKVKPINFSGADTGDLLEECVGGSCPVR